jgi:hypothetical protein
VICSIPDPDCGTTPVEICTGGVDEDGDGLIDCLDWEDCCNSTYCPTSSDEGANGKICCSNGDDDDNKNGADDADPSCFQELFDGVFNSGRTRGNGPVTFQVMFNDTSRTTQNSVDWNFRFVRATKDCLDLSFSPVLSPPLTLPIPRDKQWHLVTDLTVSVKPDKVCVVYVNATHPEPSGKPMGVYILDARNDILCPSCTVLEIPAVLHPTGMYSMNEPDASGAYLKAAASVGLLAQECASSCSAVAASKLADAQNHLGAAEYFLTGCSSDGEMCRLSQYYSSRALTLANEGLAL